MKHSNDYNRIVKNLSDSVELLDVAADQMTINNILNNMKSKIYDLYLINNLNRNTDSRIVNETLPVQTERTFTLNELAKFNGKMGMPAYVAVNGTVYDVTNNAAWGAATHFGLSAGKDLTAQFASCHAGQAILQKLTIVGKMIE